MAYRATFLMCRIENVFTGISNDKYIIKDYTKTYIFIIIFGYNEFLLYEGQYLKRMKRIAQVVFLFCLSIIVFSSFKTPVQAAFSTEDKDAIKTAPDGIDIGSILSNSAPGTKPSGDPFTTNSAQVVDSSANVSSTGKVLSLASGANTYGSMWSDKTFDINKQQTISAWMYFGKGGENTSTLNSQGMAFVLQNGDNSALGAGQQGMGVYGYDKTNLAWSLLGSGITYPTQSYIASTAIQNSLALEFDSDQNSLMATGKDFEGALTSTGSKITLSGGDVSMNAYDSGTSFSTTDSEFPANSRIGDGSAGNYGHIAVTYPSDVNSYRAYNLSDSFPNAYTNYGSALDTTFIQVHANPKSADLVDDYDKNGNSIYWHHVLITWIPAASGSNWATIKYTYDDRYTDGTITDKSSQQLTVSTKVDISQLNSSDGLVRWGFTGANGSSSSVASKLIAFDSVPDKLYADTTASVIDNTLGDTPTTSLTGNAVGAGDALTLRYDLNYDEGKESWKDILAKITLPDASQVKVSADSSGNVAYVHYKDGTTEAIPASEMKTDSSDSTGNTKYLQHSLTKSLGTPTDTPNTDNPVAYITVAGTATNTTTKKVTVKAAPATFTGSNNISTTSTPLFYINAPKTYTLKLANKDTTSAYNLLYNNSNSDVNLSTAVNYSDNHSFGDTTKNTTMQYEIKIGDKTYTVAANATGTEYDQALDLKTIINNDTDFWKIFAQNSTVDVAVTAVDQTNGLSSNTIHYTVSVKTDKSLQLTVSKSLSFEDVNYETTKKYLERKTDFDLSVKSLKVPWNLTVSTTGLTHDGTAYNGNIVYKTDDTTKYTPTTTPTVYTLDSSPDVIAKDDT